ncbi:alcohol dehydrogenase catalytic domain-containing protein [Streptomyces mirabilis]|uniref:alcohol dehydrogenase catalytic domain-containing protein n=1 Tax=Streptomyces mirabilis TaxID=68239 RepID=UPI0036A22C68
MANVVLFDETGGPGVLRLAEMSLPAPGQGQVQVQVQVQVRIDAIGLNRADTLFRAGGYYYQPTLPASRLGSEAAGVVEAVGPDTDRRRPCHRDRP